MVIRALTAAAAFLLILSGFSSNSATDYDDSPHPSVSVEAGSESMELSAPPQVEPLLNPVIIALCNAGFGDVVISEWENPVGTFALKCGDENSGYVHIREGHESSWQGVIDNHTPGGGLWDDLMEFVTGSAITHPEYGYPIDVGGGKSCYVTPVIIFDNSTGAILYEFYATIIVSDTNYRVITSYPTGDSPRC